MIEPAIQEWHRRLMFMQDTYDELFKFESHREKGTLYNIKQYSDHKGVSGNIMECFNKATELLHFATKGFTVVAAMDVLGVHSVDATPEALPCTASERRNFLLSLSADIVNMFYEKPNTKEILDSEPAQEDFQYCSCKMDIGEMMLFCSYTKCRKGQWFHIDCIGMSSEDVPEGDRRNQHPDSTSWLTKGFHNPCFRL
ncbi:uncharacterized protein LOC133201917 [Saccostrea echinata]|uniref:uncharacterized protein LOC133201917 n=1 Tax=Saccostrea echinata TaxID=191078 RepID=UPI002A8279CB|nr:uncharacterized protein LOC133201917 [Saccostrea echinata]